MSSHFSGKEEVVRRTSLRHLLSPYRPRSAGEERFVRHAMWRATAVIGFLFYFIYCNPEYSYTYSYLRETYGLGGEGTPMIPKLLELKKTPTYRGQTRCCASSVRTVCVEGHSVSMCILAFVTQFSERFPFVMVNNRDEVFSRLTHPVAIDMSTGLLCALDDAAGGSWLGLNVKSGRFAVVTNCARSPTAPLLQESAAAREAAEGVDGTPSWWRGAMPLAEAMRRTKVHASPAAGGGTDVHLEFIPDVSRGCIVRNFLMYGRLPGDSAVSSRTTTPSATREQQHSPSLQPPYYDGYNLLTAESLLDPSLIQMCYTTNRYSAKHRVPVEHGVVHCLQNSYIDNWMEPKTSLLRDCFQASLSEFLPADATPYDAEYVANSFASSCLCVEPQFDLLQEIQSGRAPAEKLDEYRQVLDASLPYLGYDGESELTQIYGAGLEPPVHFPIDAYVEHANFRQRNIFVRGKRHGTRTQTVVVVEKKPSNGSVAIHFSQRECGIDGPHKQWTHFTLPAATATRAS